MNDFFESMEHALHTSGQTGHMKITPPKPPKMRWPKEFKDPIDAAMHLDSSKPLPPTRFKGYVRPVSSHFFD